MHGIRYSLKDEYGLTNPSANIAKRYQLPQPLVDWLFDLAWAERGHNRPALLSTQPDYSPYARFGKVYGAACDTVHDMVTVMVWEAGAQRRREEGQKDALGNAG